MAEAIQINHQRAWRKHYAPTHRRMALWALDLFASRLKLDPLRPPSHPGGSAARRIEARRLAELRALGVHVPRVLDQDDASLVLEDLGSTLGAQLRAATPAGRDALLAAAVAAIADAHARGAYLGQPLPRNLVWDGELIGFLDFEEDPLEVMDLARAQARDWLMLGYGAASYFPQRTERLATLLARGLAGASAGVVDQVHATSRRLERLAHIARHVGKDGRTLARAIKALQLASRLGLLLLGVLGLDYFSDGDFDLLRMLC